ncbi:Hypothetical protein FKW44_001098 [Caligus rogercresseyi]|uniref:Uncharacterized protein n=1 Tax=Caligus rogercresseyi TaxID=217165 RepID=A0A7T8KI85_CALRO|nr:Hypothetical protein FKW44_001098 [Caligus rogercresseyi]
MPMQNGLYGDAASYDPCCGPDSVKVVADLKALNMFHIDFTWHAKVAVSLPSGYAIGLVDLMGLLGIGRRNHQSGNWHRHPRRWST